MTGAPVVPELEEVEFPLSLLRMIAPVADARARLDRRLRDPLERGLAGLGPVPDWREEPGIERAALAALAAAEAGRCPGAAALAGLEARAQGAARVWAARAAVLAVPERGRQALRMLSRSEIPYTGPGELHLLAVELFAAGDGVLRALHIDHARRLTAFLAEALPLDLRALGLWFWPLLPIVPADRLARPLAHAAGMPRLPPGARGLAAAYAWRLGLPVDRLLAGAGPLDAVVLDLARAADRAAGGL